MPNPAPPGRALDIVERQGEPNMGEGLEVLILSNSGYFQGEILGGKGSSERDVNGVFDDGWWWSAWANSAPECFHDASVPWTALNVQTDWLVQFYNKLRSHLLVLRNSGRNEVL